MYMDCGAKGGNGVKYGEKLAALAWYAAVAALVWAGVRYALVWLLPFTLKEVIIGYEQFGKLLTGLVFLRHAMHPFEVKKVIFLI